MINNPDLPFTLIVPFEEEQENPPDDTKSAHIH